MLGACIMPCIFIPMPQCCSCSNVCPCGCNTKCECSRHREDTPPPKCTKDCVSRSTSTHAPTTHKIHSEHTHAHTNHKIHSEHKVLSSHDIFRRPRCVKADDEDETKAACANLTCKQVMIPHSLHSQYKENVFNDVISEVPWDDVLQTMCPLPKEKVIPLELRLTSGCEVEAKEEKPSCSDCVCRRPSKDKDKKREKRKYSDPRDSTQRRTSNPKEKHSKRIEFKHRNSKDKDSRHSDPKSTEIGRKESKLRDSIVKEARERKLKESKLRDSRSSKVSDSKRKPSRIGGPDDSRNASNNRLRRRRARRARARRARARSLSSTTSCSSESSSESSSDY